MPPQQPQQQNSGQYDFFMNPEKPPSRNPLNPFGGGVGGGVDSSLLKRVVIILVGAVVLIMLLVIISSLFSGSSNVPRLVIVAEDQNELINLTNTGTQQATEVLTQNFSQSCQLSAESEQAQLINFIANHGGQKPSAKTLALKESNAINTELNNAVASSTFDSTYISVMQAQLNTYKNDINTAYKYSQNNAEKQLLASEFTDAQLLLQELDSPDQ